MRLLASMGYQKGGAFGKHGVVQDRPTVIRHGPHGLGSADIVGPVDASDAAFCDIFANALARHISMPSSGDVGTDPNATVRTPITDAAPLGGEPTGGTRSSWLRPRVLLRT